MSLVGIIAIIFTFGVAILAHEFGHFLLAKVLGVGVETFSIGMGKKLVKIKWGETTYCLSAIPFGGYVVLKGAMSKEMEEELNKEKEKESEKETVKGIDSDEVHEKTPEKEPAEKAKQEESKSLTHMATEDIEVLREKPLWVKIAIYASGVTFNYIVAIITFSIILMIGLPQSPPKPPLVGYVPADSVLAEMGVKAGDRILSVNGKDVEHFEDVYSEMFSVMENGATTFSLIMKRPDDGKYKIYPPMDRKDPRFSSFAQYFSPPHKPYIGEVIYNQPAEKAGMQPGDMILAIDGKKVDYWSQMAQIIRSSPDCSLTFTIRRDDEITTITTSPCADENDPGVGKLGIVMGDPETKIYSLPPWKAVPESVGTSVRIIQFVAVSTYEMFSRFDVGEIRGSMGGPVAIAVQSYRQVKRGWIDFFYFFGAFNIMLAMINILPLPILDGGHILFSIIETIRGKPIAAKTLVRIYTIMFIILISLALLLTINDIIQNWWRFTGS